MKKITFRIFGIWKLSSKETSEEYLRMSQDGKGKWENIQLVDESTPIEEVDYAVVINGAANVDILKFDTNRIILFQMEPQAMTTKLKFWGHIPQHGVLFSNQSHAYAMNNLQWQVSPTYTDFTTPGKVDLTKYELTSSTNVVSMLLSQNNYYPGHASRIRLAQYLTENKFPFDIWGRSKGMFGIPSDVHKGELPLNKKDDALMKYKYTIEFENHNENNYFTERVVDAVLCETVVFYNGCPNITDFINPECVIIIPADEPEVAMKIMLDAILNDEWSKRIDGIRQSKTKILNNLQFFPRLFGIINNTR